MSEIQGSHPERTKQTKIYLPRTCLVRNLHYSRGVKLTLYSGSSVDGPNCRVPCLPHRVVVGAPKETRATNQTGGLYKCGYDAGKCEPVHLQGES